jgi:hypothetical protein
MFTSFPFTLGVDIFMDFTFGTSLAARKAARKSILSGLPRLVFAVLDTRFRPDPLQLNYEESKEKAKYVEVNSFTVKIVGGKQFQMRIYRRLDPPPTIRVEINDLVQLAIRVASDSYTTKEYNTVMRKELEKSSGRTSSVNILRDVLTGKQRPQQIVGWQSDVLVPRYCPNQSSCALHCALAFLLSHRDLCDIINANLSTVVLTECTQSLLVLWTLLQPMWSHLEGGRPIYLPKAKKTTWIKEVQAMVRDLMGLVSTEKNGRNEDPNEIMMKLLDEPFFNCKEARDLFTVQFHTSNFLRFF